MTGRERMQMTLRFEQPDRPPHWESMFELEREAFGLQFPDRTAWATCTAAEKEQMIGQCMEVYARIIERYEWDALAVFWPWGDPDGIVAARREVGSDTMIGSIVGGGIWAIECINDWTRFSSDLYEHPERLHEQAEMMLATAIHKVDTVVDAGAEFVFLAHDVAFNAGPFISPDHFSEFVTPYLARLVEHTKGRGVYAIVHSDGMLMPVLDQILSTEPHCLHSIDPMAGMDIAEVKRITAGKVALMGNVQCNLLQDGPDEAIRESALYCLEHASAGGGYIFSSSNTVFPGMPLRNYEYMLQVFSEFNEGRA